MSTYQPLSPAEEVFWRKVREEFLLAPNEIYLNSGTWSAVPRRAHEAVIAALREVERNPTMQLRILRERAAWVRDRIADYAGSKRTDLVFFPNVTMAINALLRGLPLQGGEAIYSDQEYGASVTALRFVAMRRGMTVRSFPLPQTPHEPAEIVDAVRAALRPETRLVLLSHVTSPTGMVLPVEHIGPLLAERGVRFVVDGAHAPGSVPLYLDRLVCDGYGGNLHKWFLGPKGTAFAWVPQYHQGEIDPLIVGFGGFRQREQNPQTTSAPMGTKFQASFGMQGCFDLSPFLGLATTLDFRTEIGEERILTRLRQLAAYTRAVFARELGWRLVTPTHPELSAAMSTFEMPAFFRDRAPDLQTWFYERYRITVAFHVPAGSSPLIRISPHIYNSEAEIDRLTQCLKQELDTFGNH